MLFRGRERLDRQRTGLANARRPGPCEDGHMFPAGAVAPGMAEVRCGRDLAARPGLVPRWYAPGGKAAPGEDRKRARPVSGGARLPAHTEALKKTAFDHSPARSETSRITGGSQRSMMSSVTLPHHALQNLVAVFCDSHDVKPAVKSRVRG